ncbi:MAG: type II secretion system ATPase GspE [Gammaproteobacteria bacterium]
MVREIQNNDTTQAIKVVPVGETPEAEATEELLKLPFSFAKNHGVVLGQQQDHCVEIIHHRTLALQTLAELRRFLGRSLRFLQVEEEAFVKLLTQAYESNRSEAAAMLAGLEQSLDLQHAVDALPEASDLLEAEDDAPIIRLINTLFAQAINQAVSDIHFETEEDNLRVRFRVDGILQEVLNPKRGLAPFVMSRIKVMAKLDIAEKRLPQDGHISLRIAGRSIDVRVSTMPANHGERIVLRLLDKNNTKLDLSTLGMSDATLPLMEKLIHEPHGIILVTGPTGSGKSTTLYAALSQLNTKERNILTVEDPVEYDLPGISQTPVNTKIGMTFAKGLRAMLRQDPDIVMVGEIRDDETSGIAVQASLTGHLVLSTLHTNTAVGAILRMQDLGVEPFLLSSSLIGVLAQRLVRKLCPNCKQAFTASAKQCEMMEIEVDQAPTLYRAAGCEDCEDKGYRGRIGIYELIAIDEQIRDMIYQEGTEHDILNHCRKHYPSIRTDGYTKVLAGITTLEEVARVTSESVGHVDKEDEA